MHMESMAGGSGYQHRSLCYVSRFSFAQTNWVKPSGIALKRALGSRTRFFSRLADRARDRAFQDFRKRTGCQDFSRLGENLDRGAVNVVKQNASGGEIILKTLGFYFPHRDHFSHRLRESWPARLRHFSLQLPFVRRCRVCLCRSPHHALGVATHAWWAP